MTRCWRIVLGVLYVIFYVGYAVFEVRRHGAWILWVFLVMFVGSLLAQVLWYRWRRSRR